MTEGEVFNDSKDVFLGSRVAFYEDADRQTIFRGFIEHLPDNVDAGHMINVKFDCGGCHEFNKKEILGK
jgi:hypothetical protein